MKGFGGNSPRKVHPNFAQNMGRQILGNTFSGLNLRKMQRSKIRITKIGCTRRRSYSAKGVFLPSKHLLSAFYKTEEEKVDDKSTTFDQHPIPCGHSSLIDEHDHVRDEYRPLIQCPFVNRKP